MRNVEKVAADHYKNYPVKDKLTLSALGTTSLDHVMTDQAVFEWVRLYLILSDYLPTAGVENLNKTSKSFDHFYTMLLHAEPSLTCKFLQHNPDYAFQTNMPIKLRL